MRWGEKVTHHEGGEDTLYMRWEERLIHEVYHEGGEDTP